MSITLITGLPGAGKSLFAISKIRQLAAAEDRLVYYYGIPELKLPWVPLVDPLKWFELPAGSIIVIDEAQKVFRVRASAAAVPTHVSAFETHRHLGIDVFLITQHPTLLDQHVRRLISSHFHLLRKFGMQYSTVHEFYEVRDNPDKSRQGAITHQFSFPKDVFSLYKSADLHTVKRRIPPRVWFILGAPVVLLGLVFLISQMLSGRLSDYKTEDVKKKSSVASSGGSVSNKGGSRVDIDDYVASRAPVIPGIGFTAPIYAEVIRPVVAPLPLACIASATRCLCSTEQGTQLADIPESTCRSIVERGFFVDSERRSIAGAASGERQRDTLPAPAQSDSGVAVPPVNSSAVTSVAAASSPVASAAGVVVPAEADVPPSRVFKGSPHKAR